MNYSNLTIEIADRTFDYITIDLADVSIDIENTIEEGHGFHNIENVALEYTILSSTSTMGDSVELTKKMIKEMEDKIVAEA